MKTLVTRLKGAKSFKFFCSKRKIKELDNLFTDHTSPEPEDKAKPYTPVYLKQYSVVLPAETQSEPIKHDIIYQGKLYKYDLPIKNEPLPSLTPTIIDSQIDLTPMENTMLLFDLTKDSSFESLILKYNMLNNGKHFNFRSRYVW